jgi:rfaE bifunctional protein nucleotidyltransferase chain/domain
LFGNGGSAAAAQHLAAEFIGRLRIDRRPLPAIALTTDTSTLTAIGNDYGFEHVFARQLEALGRPGDVAIAISSSGGSPNVLEAVRLAAARGLRTLGLIGARNSELGLLVDIAVIASGAEYAVQEAQLTAAHVLCELVELTLFGPSSPRWDPGHLANARTKLVSWAELQELREQWRVRDARVVWTNGCFDLLHVGHVRSLEAARALGDVLVVGINDDASVRELKGAGRPVVPVEQRAELVAALTAVDYVVVFDDRTPNAALARLRPDVHAKGADYAKGDLPEQEVVEGYGGAIELLPLVPGVSTSSLLSRARTQEP